MPVFTAFSRHLLTHPWQLVLAIVGVSIGVAVVIAIQLTQTSAFRSFEDALLSNSGNASHQIVATRGNWITHQQYRDIRQSWPAVVLSPVVDFRIKLDRETDRSLYVLGIEPISRARFERAADVDGAPVALDVQALIAEPGHAAINARTATQFDLQSGDRISGTLDGKRLAFDISQILPAAGNVVGDSTLLIDIATAQEHLGIYDRVRRIDLYLPSSRTDAQTFSDSLPNGLELIDLAVETRDMQRMTDAFYTNLTALSLMALLVGMFLIYNTETFLVLQRREMIARLRAIGVSKRQVFLAVLCESACLGLLGSLIGLAMGTALAGQLIKHVSTTLTDLYYQAGSNDIVIEPAVIGLGLILGILSTVVAGIIPARAAAQAAPASYASISSTVERKTLRFPVGSGLAAIGFFVSAIAVLNSHESIVAGFVAIALSLLGFAALCPLVIVALVALLGRHDSSPDSGMLIEKTGLRTVGSSLGRASTATAALMIATAAGIGIGVMVASFRVSVAAWLEDALRADFYVSRSFSISDNEQRAMSDRAKESIKNLDGVAGVSTVLRIKTTAVFNSGTEKIRLSAFDLNAMAKQGFRFIESMPDLWQRWSSQDAVIVTEPFAYHHRLALGDRLRLATDSLAREFTIVGIYVDYASEQGGVSINRAVFDRYWRREGYHGIGVYAAGNSDLIQLQQALDEFGSEHLLDIQSTQRLTEQSLAVFDRTFVITDLLRSIAIAVAFIGIVGALLAQQLERVREYGMYRAIGLRPSEITRLVLTQTLSLGIVAAVIAIPAGLSVAWILIEVINPRSFGWTMTTEVPSALLFKSAAVAFAAALIAGLVPAYRLCRIAPAEALRFE